MMATSKNTPEATLGKRLALVIGVNQTCSPSQSPLLRTLNDANAMAEVLQRKCGFDLQQPALLDKQATSDAIRKAIKNLAHNRTDDDFLLVYFSGHGKLMQVGADLPAVYLGSSDFDERDVRHEEGSNVVFDEEAHISFRWLRSLLFEGTHAGRVLLILDCCYAGNMGGTAQDHDLEELHARIKYYFGVQNRAIRVNPRGLYQTLAATGPNRMAKEDDMYGLMTGLMLPVLRGEVVDVLEAKQGGALSLQGLHRHLEVNMPLEQRPSLSGDTAGRSCILAYHLQSIATTPVVGTERPKNYILVPRTPLFQPPDEFERLKALLFDPPPAQRPLRLGLGGMRGIGKTQLAVQLAYCCQEQGCFPAGIFWMTATGNDIFAWQRQFADLAKLTDYLPLKDDVAHPENEELRARHFCRYLAEHADALLILDDVTVPDLITTVFPALAGKEAACAILYTSYITARPEGVTMHPMKLLHEPAAQRLLLQEVRSSLLTQIDEGISNAEIAAASQICERVGYLPLALIHLRGYLRRDRQVTLMRLHEELINRGAFSLIETLFSTFQLSWEQVRGEEARRLFQLAAFFTDATPIPLWLLGLTADLAGDGEILTPLGRVCHDLEELNLVEELTGELVRLHPLVREFGRRLVQAAGNEGVKLLQGAGQRLLHACTTLSTLEARARRVGYDECVEHVRSMRETAKALGQAAEAGMLARFVSILEHESYLLGDTYWWPTRLPGLFQQQVWYRGLEQQIECRYGNQPHSWMESLVPVHADDPALIRRFVGHTTSVNSVAFSADGRFVLSGSYFDDRTVRLWDTSSGAEVRRFVGHGGSVNSVAFSPDGNFLLSGSLDNTLRLWNVADETEVRSFVGHEASVNSVAFSPDGRFVLSGSDDRTVRLWDVDSGKELYCFVGHTDSVSSVAFSPDGQFLLSGSGDQTARLWDFNTGAKICCFDNHTNWLSSVAFSPDGRFLLVGDDQGRIYWHLLEKQGDAHVLLSLFDAASPVQAFRWLDEQTVLLADTGGGSNHPRVYRLRLHVP